MFRDIVVLLCHAALSGRSAGPRRQRSETLFGRRTRLLTQPQIGPLRLAIGISALTTPTKEPVQRFDLFSIAKGVGSQPLV